ncbi:hypothetical protein BpHYR1_044021 [Brachionus plicatilis]|uniref:Uncharacterized protein n=1 Tax=Brachionus plicatilis TaxID=10195 RepID=A0A3M7Q045_BRAPC|nr:hypothetical protein BpHYR1_044021 [Brachionus plicatilis]
MKTWIFFLIRPNDLNATLMSSKVFNYPLKTYSIILKLFKYNIEKEYPIAVSLFPKCSPLSMLKHPAPPPNP